MPYPGEVRRELEVPVVTYYCIPLLKPALILKEWKVAEVM